jgi:hypothetical protein
MHEIRNNAARFYGQRYFCLYGNIKEAKRETA